MSMSLRTTKTGRIDRTRPLSFRFDGELYRGFHGDTLASALLANGVHLMGRSFKYHRPRGVVTAGSDEPNALVSVGVGAKHTPNLRATQVELYDGLVAQSQNRWPSLSFDVGAINNLLSPLFVAGFYYKTFMWPNVAWKKLYEPIIRRVAGLGTASNEPDPDHYSTRFAHCDVMVIGTGPAGLAAALSAARSGARVIVCDEQAELGGSLLSELHASIDGKPASQWIVDTIAELRGFSPTVTMLPRTQAFGYFAQNFIGLVEGVTDHLAKPDPKLPRDRLWQVRAKEVVIATGAHERPLVFPDNDRPGIMLANAARIFANRYGVRPGGRAVIATAHDSAYQAALDLKAAGVAIAMVTDVRKEANGPLPMAARAAGIRVETGTAITGSTGHLRVKAALVSKLGTDGEEAVPCDLILMCGGWTPSVHLFSQSRGKLVFDEARQVFIPGTSAQAERSAGACKGSETLLAALEEGFVAGYEAAAKSGFSKGAVKPVKVGGVIEAHGGYLGAVPHPHDAGRVKAFVDFQNDVTAKDIKLATREGMRSIEHVKRYTTTGMATDQGKL
jgi:sarcosine oxidase subunit alpha